MPSQDRTTRGGMNGKGRLVQRAQQASRIFMLPAIVMDDGKISTRRRERSAAEAGVILPPFFVCRILPLLLLLVFIRFNIAYRQPLNLLGATSKTLTARAFVLLFCVFCSGERLASPSLLILHSLLVLSPTSCSPCPAI